MNVLARNIGPALLLAATACNTGLDPRRLELLHYDMELDTVAATLGDDAGLEPRLRFFLTEPDGTTSDWLVQHTQSAVPAPGLRAPLSPPEVRRHLVAGLAA